MCIYIFVCVMVYMSEGETWLQEAVDASMLLNSGSLCGIQLADIRSIFFPEVVADYGGNGGVVES